MSVQHMCNGEVVSDRNLLMEEGLDRQSDIKRQSYESLMPRGSGDWSMTNVSGLSVEAKLYVDS